MIEIIAQFVEEQSRLSFPAHRRKFFTRAIEERALRAGTPHLSQYFSRLRDCANEQTALLELLTVNETSFFRNPGQFRFLAERIVPELEKGRLAEDTTSRATAPPGVFSRKKLRVLSAGCATGEEPYSVAMALHAALRYPRAWEIEILAGDLSERCLSSAAHGYFPNERLRGVPESLAARYLEKQGDGALVNREIRSLVRFLRLNLAEVMDGYGFPLAGDFDIIFCRNVMIYFSLATQQRLVDTLFRLLKPGGYLFTGDAEPLHLFAHQFASLHEAGCLVYRKSEVTADD